MYEDLPQLVANLGFPIAVVLYLLWERHTNTKSLELAIRDELVGAIHELREEIIRICTFLNDRK